MMKKDIIEKSNQQFMPDFIKAVKAIDQNKTRSLIFAQIKQLGKAGIDFDEKIDDLLIVDLPIDGSNPSLHYVIQQINTPLKNKIGDCVYSLAQHGANFLLKNKDQKNALDLIYEYADEYADYYLNKIEAGTLDKELFLKEKELAHQRYKGAKAAKKVKFSNNNNEKTIDSSDDIRNALFKAVMSNDEEILDKCYRQLNIGNHRPFYSIITDDKESALHMAVKFKKYNSIKSLMSLISRTVIDFNDLGFIPDASGKTPVDLALENNDEFALQAMTEYLPVIHKRIFREKAQQRRFLHTVKSKNVALIIQYYNELVKDKLIHPHLISEALKMLSPEDSSLRDLLTNAYHQDPFYKLISANDYKPSLKEIVDSNNPKLLVAAIKNSNDWQTALELAIKENKQAVIEEIGKIVATRSVEEQIQYLTRITDQNLKTEPAKKAEVAKDLENVAVSKEEKKQVSNNNSNNAPASINQNLIDFNEPAKIANPVLAKNTVNTNNHIKFYPDLGEFDAEIKLRKKQLSGNRTAYLFRYSLNSNEIIISRLVAPPHEHFSIEKLVKAKELNFDNKEQINLLVNSLIQFLDEGIKRHGKNFIVEFAEHKDMLEFFANTEFARKYLPKFASSLAQQPTFFKPNAQPPAPIKEAEKPQPKVESKKLREDDIPEEFMCPLSLSVMDEPVLCALDNITYEKADITNWLKLKGTSPVNQDAKLNGQPIDEKLLRPQFALKSLIARFRKDHPELFENNTGPQPK